MRDRQTSVFQHGFSSVVSCFQDSRANENAILNSTENIDFT